MDGRSTHAFRFFVDSIGAPGQVIELDATDAHHARVLHRGATGEPVELVDGDGSVWRSTFDGPSARLVLNERIGQARERASIELLAFVSVGGRTDELVDGAVQAGATRIVPIVRSQRDRAKVDARHERLLRVARSAAKQARRASIPEVSRPIAVDELRGWTPGVIVDPDADATLDAVLRESAFASATTLLVGGADGFPDGVVDELVDLGWRRGRLGASILRAELASAVAVAIAAMLAPGQ